MHKTVTETQTYTINVCDICGENSRNFRCRICEKDICLDCATPICEVRMWRYDDGDYPTMYCKSCWEKGKDCRDQLDRIDRIRDAAEEVTMNEWKEKCK